MADWSTLPNDLLLQIGDSLRSPLDVLRFRSVCSSWRSSLHPKLRHLPDTFPIIPNGGISSSTWGFRLFKRTIYRFYAEDESDWIVKISEDVSDQMQLSNPLSGERFKPLELLNLDLLKIRVCEVEEEYVMHLFDKWPYSNWFGEGSCLYDQRVAFRYDEEGEANPTLCNADAAGFMLLTISVSGRLAVFKSGDKKCKVIKEMVFVFPYVDVKVYKGKFYAVDSSGRIVIVKRSSRIELVADSVFGGGGDVKRLVVSCGELLLIDMWFNLDVEEGEDDDMDERLLRSLDEDRVTFKVYKLAESQRKWVEMESLGDQVLFFGKNCPFAASAADIDGCDGNCIFIMYGIDGIDDRQAEVQAAEVAVYHIHSSKIELLTVESKLWKLFWPPPAWVSVTVGGQEGLAKEQM